MSFDSKLFLTIIAVITTVGARLYLAALETGNWKGALISMAHISIVGIAGYFALRNDAELDQTTHKLP